MELSKIQIEALRKLANGGRITRTIDEDTGNIDFIIEDSDQNGAYLYKQTFEFLRNEGFIEIDSNPEPLMKTFKITHLGTCVLVDV